MFNSVCYQTCPGTGIPDINTMSCISCDSSCLTCSGSTTNCTSCKGGTYIYLGTCFSICPNGLIADAITNSCQKSNLGGIVYFPCSITFLLWLIIVIFSRYNFQSTQTITALAAGLALILWSSWVILVFGTYSSDINLEASTKTLVLGVGLAGIMISLGLGIGFNFWLKRAFGFDAGLLAWKERS